MQLNLVADLFVVPGEKRYLLEEMAPSGLELIIGAKRDDSFGPTVIVGHGGTAINLHPIDK